MGAGTSAVIRVATYNVHKCRGLDRRVSVERIASVIKALDADVIAVQEILNGTGTHNQVRAIAAHLGYKFAFGENREHAGLPYGNATFSRLPIVRVENYDITWARRERRGCLRTDIEMKHGRTLHLFNVHLGTSFFERPHQAHKLLSSDLLLHPELRSPRIVVGDFNEWTRGVATRLMGSRFKSVDAKLLERGIGRWSLRRLLPRRNTYPGVLPLLHLDYFYYDDNLRLVSSKLLRTRTSLVASDHLPIVAEFTLADPKSHNHADTHES